MVLLEHSLGCKLNRVSLHFRTGCTKLSQIVPKCLIFVDKVSKIYLCEVYSVSCKYQNIRRWFLGIHSVQCIVMFRVVPGDGFMLHPVK